MRSGQDLEGFFGYLHAIEVQRRPNSGPHWPSGLSRISIPRLVQCEEVCPDGPTAMCSVNLSLAAMEGEPVLEVGQNFELYVAGRFLREGIVVPEGQPDMRMFLGHPLALHIASPVWTCLHVLKRGACQTSAADGRDDGVREDYVNRGIGFGSVVPAGYDSSGQLRRFLHPHPWT